MDLIKALRLADPASRQPVISLAGSGGKTSLLFALAQELSQRSPVLVSASTHLGSWQTSQANYHLTAEEINDLDFLPNQGIILVTGTLDGERTRPLRPEVLQALYEIAKNKNLPLLIEADGSRQKPVKAPADHEPAIPSFSTKVIVCAGLSALGAPLTEAHVHRPEQFAHLSGSTLGHPIAPEALARVLLHPQGGLKNIPVHAEKIVFLNQADNGDQSARGGSLAKKLLPAFDTILVGSIHHKSLVRLEPTAGILLAAGSSTRYGKPKQLLDWKGKPFVRHVAETALQAGLWPVVVVTGHSAPQVESCLSGLPVQMVHNPQFKEGQSTSIRAGVSSLPAQTGASFFLLADQPHIPVGILHALMETHAKSMDPIIAPMVREEFRANPVLFDRTTFPSLLALKGDIGGRAIFSQYKMQYLPWQDESLLLDIDTPEEYRQFLQKDQST